MAPNIDRLLHLVERELGIETQGLNPDTHLADLADSLDWVNLIAAVEESYGLRISTADGLRLQTLGDLMHLVQPRVEPQLAAA